MSALSRLDVPLVSALSTVDAAIMYASKRVSIIPVDPGASKAPLVQWTAYQRQVPSQVTVDRWFTKDFPGASIGIVAGKINGIFAVDLDSDEDAEFFFDKFPYTEHSLTIKTPRGFHVYFQYRDGLKNRVKVFDRKIDVRTSGGYVRAPTSHGYRFLNAGPILAAPPELIAALTSERNITRFKALRDGEPIPEGIRNDSLFRMGCGLQGSGYEDAQIVAAIEAANAKLAVPPLASGEIESICRSIFKYPKGNRSAVSPASLRRVPPGYYICEATRHYPLEWKNRQSHVVEWIDVATGNTYRQFFNQHNRYSPKSKAVVNYYLLFGQYPKRLDRVDFARFVGTIAVVRVFNSKPTLEWAKEFPGLSLPADMTESRVDNVVCALSTNILIPTDKEGEGE